jgi:hypothetical protein
MTYKLEDKLFHFEEDYTFGYAASIPPVRTFGLGDLPEGPEPGPEMPKRRKLIIP